MLVGLSGGLFCQLLLMRPAVALIFCLYVMFFAFSQRLARQLGCWRSLAPSRGMGPDGLANPVLAEDKIRAAARSVLIQPKTSPASPQLVAMASLLAASRSCSRCFFESCGVRFRLRDVE